jgi:hypothetical protein
MKRYTDEEIKELFPGPGDDPVAEIVPRVRTMRVMSDPPPKHANNGFYEDVLKETIKIKYNRQTGTNPMTGGPIYDITSYVIGRFEVGQRLRTDNLGNATREIPPCELIRILLTHSSHKNENGDVLVYDLVEVEPERFTMEKNKGGRPRKVVEEQV